MMPTTRLSLLLAIGMALSQSCGLASSEQEPDDGAGQPALLARVYLAQRAVKTVTGTLTHRTVRPDEPADEAEIYLATFALKAPDCYNVEYTRPSAPGWIKRLCSDGKQRWQIEQFDVGMAPDETVEAVPAGGDGKDLGKRLTSFLRLDPEELARDFSVVVTAKADGGCSLELTPRDAGLAEQVKRIEVEFDPDLHTSAIRLDDPQGNRVIVTIETAVYNQEIAPEVFISASKSETAKPVP